MYRESASLVSFLLGLSLILAAGLAFAEPATEESLVLLEASVSQNTFVSIIIGHVVLVILGFIAGQQR